MLAGREQILAAFDVLRQRAEQLGEGDRSWVLTGLRGVGKTVLLNELLARVSGRGWITAKVEAGASGTIPVSLSQSLVRSLRAATGRSHERTRRLLGIFKAFSLKLDPTGAISFGLDVQPEQGIADSGRLPQDLAALFEALGVTARDLGIGVLLLIDELQEASREELVALNTAVHQAGQGAEALPVIVIGAGLPSLPAQLADATSYAERLYDYRAIGLLDEEATRQAFTVPTVDRGVQWDADGLMVATDNAGGYPFFIQAIGKHVWDNAVSDRISLDDVLVGLADARKEVDNGLYRSRWERATPAQREVLRALAVLQGDRPAAVADLAHHLGKGKTSDLSVARNELIKKGLAYAPERGFLAFTVPGMHEFIRRQP